MKIGMDVTPLLGRMTGIGTYTAHLLERLADRLPADELVATAFTWRGRESLVDHVPDGVSLNSRPVSARVLREAWLRCEYPVVERLCGPVDVFHATNFVLPPTRSAAGVVTVHDLAYLNFPETVSRASSAYRELVPRSLSRAAMVMTPSRAVAEQLQDAYGLVSDRLTVTHLGVDRQWFSAQRPPAPWLAQHRLPPEYLLAVGTLEPRKNLGALVSAYALLSLRGESIPPLVIVGGHGWGPKLDLAGLGPDRVMLTGHLPREDLRSVVAGAALLVFPSLDEGFGLPPLEALACGVPVLASDIPVTREVLGDQAHFADTTDAEAFSSALLHSIMSPVGDSDSRRRLSGQFSWASCADKTYEAYRRVVI